MTGTILSTEDSTPPEKQSMTTSRRPKLLAVIELGTTSIRMVVGQAIRGGGVQILDELDHAVSLGRDTLTSRAIGPATTERCVSALRSFRQVLSEYGIEDTNVRAVATSAVREAVNRDTFMDRILVATGFQVNVLDQAEVSRLTYRAVRPQLKAASFFRKSDVLVVEVGGGSTETLLFRKGKVSGAHLYRLGALRLRTLLDNQEAPRGRSSALLRAEMQQTLSQIRQSLALSGALRLVLLGSDARLACARLCPKRESHSLCKLSVSSLGKFAKVTTGKSVDEVAKEYGITYTEAETLGPSLAITVALAKELKLKSVLVGEATLRSGILSEMTTGERWTAEFRRQVISSAQAITRKYSVDPRHARHVAAYGQQIIDVLCQRYNITERDEVIYQVGALLHEIGQAVNGASHHKHSQYLILNSDIFGLSRKDITLAAMVARYHRRAAPKPSHMDYMALDRRDRITVSKLAAIIRVANALDRLHSPRPMKMNMQLDEKRLIIEISGEHDISLLQARVKGRSKLFQDIFGKEILLRAKRK